LDAVITQELNELETKFQRLGPCFRLTRIIGNIVRRKLNPKMEVCHFHMENTGRRYISTVKWARISSVLY